MRLIFKININQKLKIMIATVELYEPLLDYLKTKTKHRGLKTLVHVIKIGSIIVIKPSEASAHRYLTKLGFVLNESVQYELKYKSEDELSLERNYRKL